MKNNRNLIMIALIILLFASCKGEKKTTKTDKEKKFKVGFITVGPVTDWGYNQAHEEGRAYINEHSKDISTTMVEQIPESAEVERVMERMIANGTNMIFPTSYGYLEPALRVAKKHPDVAFMHCGGFKKSDNLGTYFGYIHEPMYLSGMAAGKMTKTNTLGFIAAFPIPQVLRNINAFTLGARSVNPKVEVRVVWTSNWYDPATEAEATIKVIQAGADVVTMHQDSPLTVVQTAEKHGVMSVGYHLDINKFAPEGWITGAQWNWGKLYLDLANSVKNKTWKSDQLRFSMNSGYIGISKFGKNVPIEVQEEVLAFQKKIVSGEYVVFQGPLKDRDGNVKLKKGDEVTFDWMESMDYFVEGVLGSIPKK